MTVEDGKTVAKPETDPAKNGYDFGGWQNGEAEYDFSAAVKSDLALTAKWTAHAYTITYELNGGTNHAENPATYTIETEEITLKDPTGPAAAPVFQGWYSDKDLQNRVNPAVIAKGSTGDRTFYARFGAEALKEFTVTFNVVAEAGGAVLGTDSIKVNDGDKISDAQLEAAKAKIASLGDYEYDGIYTDAALTAAFDTSAKISADTALYVKVKAVQKFTVTFDSDGGSAVAAVTVKSGEKAAKPADPAKDGYTFKGWLLGDAEYSFDAPVTGDITLKAKWEANKTEPEPTPVEPASEFDVISKTENSYTVEKPTMKNLWGAAVKGNVITFSGNSAAAWDNAELSNYDAIEIFYTTEKASNAKLSVKSSDGSKHEDVGYPELSASGSLKYYLSDFKAKNTSFNTVCLANNANDNDWTSGPKWDDDWSVTITKIVLTKIEKLEDKVVFDPNADGFTAPEKTELVEKDGKKFIKVTPDGYSTSFNLAAAVEVSGYTKVVVEAYADETSSGWQFAIGLRDYSVEDNKKQAVANPTSDAVSDVKEISSAIDNDGQVTAIQPFTQSKSDWSALSDKTIYIGKIVAKTE